MLSERAVPPHHIRSPFATAPPTSRLRRAGLRKTRTFLENGVQATDCFGSSTWIGQDGVVTWPCSEREVSVPQELSGRCDCCAPRVHRRGAKRAVRLGR